jgi:prepilin-type N-terminal cleavage/methylation domain-containing protein
MKNSKLGLTLIEVMAVLVVLVVIALICFPVFACGCASPGTACMSNIKQSGLSVTMYIDDNNDRFPEASTWIDRLKPYSKNEGIFQDREGVKDGSYGYAFRKTASSIDLAEIRSPAEFIIVFDSTLMGRNATSELWSLPHPGRHKGADIVCFADGHAKRLSLGDESKPDQVSPLQKALVADDNAGPHLR